MRVVNGAILLALSLVFVGCSDSTSKSSDSVFMDPSGIWIGHQSIINNGVYDMRTIIYDGNFYGISEDANISYSGKYDMQSKQFLVANSIGESNNSYKLYNLSTGNYIADGMTALNIKEKRSFSGPFENSLNQEGSIDANFTTLYTKSSSLEYITTTSTSNNGNIDVTNLGIISGTIADCKIDGNITIPDSSINIYKISFMLNECINSGLYNGLGIIALDNNSSAYFMALNSNNTRMENLAWYLDATPASFVEKSTSSKKTRAEEVIADTTSYYGYFVSKNMKTLKNTKSCIDCDLSNEILSYGNYSQVNLGGANLSKIKAIETNFESGVFSYYYEGNTQSRYDDNDAKQNGYKGANFSNADLTQSNFVYSDLKGVNFTKAILIDANLSITDLTSAKFIGTNMNHTDLRGANLDDADFNYAYLKDAKLFNTSTIFTLFGNTWWTDGSRCNAISIGTCFPKIFNNGLTYEEYLAGKDDLSKDLEKIEKTGEEIIDGGKKFVSNINTGIKHLFRRSW